MGIYYSSVGTRLERRLADEGLTIEDFAVLNPKLCFYIRQLGKKSVSAIYDSLEEKGMKPGEWDGVPNAMFYRAISYYKEHKEEIRKEHPIVYINKKDSKQVDSVDWSSFRREAAKDILAGFCASGTAINKNVTISFVIELTDELIKQLKQE